MKIYFFIAPYLITTTIFVKNSGLKVENILDNDSTSEITDIPDRLWLEILGNPTKYPNKVVETARQQLLLRNINAHLSRIAQAEPQDKPAGIFLWIRSNPVLCVLTVLAAVVAGYKGALVVLISVYASIRQDEAVQRNIWRSFGFALVFLTAVAVAVSYFVRR